jgi:xanthine dehydrogenase YagR molybdenum-binding subunit
MSDPHVPTSMPTANRPINLGASLNDDTGRLEAVAKVTGAARYARDTYLPDSVFVAFVRCPYGAAELESMDEAAALAVPGVLEVDITGDHGVYHGQPVGHVVAEGPLALKRGLRALNAKWKPRPVRTQITDEIDEPPPLTGAVRQLLASADKVLSTVYSTPVQTHSCAETHGACVDHRGDHATVHISTQGTFSARDGLEAPLGLSRSQFEVLCEYIGGGFGSKLHGPGKEGTTAARVSARHRRPAYLFVDRAEDHLDTGNRPSSRTYVDIGFNTDGTVVGGRIRTVGGVGVGSGGGGVKVPSTRFTLGEIAKSHQNVRFNAGAPRPMRAPGCPQGAFVEELMLDEIATRAGIDPVALREKLDDEESRREMYAVGAELIGWRQRQATGTQRSVVRRGFGVGSTHWGRKRTVAEAEVIVHRDGSVEVRSGSQDIGTGQRTLLGVVAADALGVPLRHVEVHLGRSVYPVSPASGGSATAHTTAPATRSAALEARRKLLADLSEHLDAAPGELDIEKGEVLLGRKPVMPWAEACRWMAGEKISGFGRWDRQAQAADRSRGHSRGVQFIDLRVDTETGVIRVDRVVAIQACGKAVTRKTAESQIIGGVSQGISYALFEDKILDRNVGAMVNPNLETYKIIGAADVPMIVPVLWTKGQTGVRSLGEPPAIPTAGAVAAAVYNAIGTPIRHLPLTPDKVLAAVEGGRA